MANKFPQMKKSEILALANEVAASLKTIGAAELEKLTKSEGSISGSPERSGSPLGKGDLPPEGSVSGSASGSPEGSSGSPGGSPEGSASAGGPPPAGPEGSAPPAAPPGPEGSAPPPGPEGSAPPAGPDQGAPPAGPSFEELVSLYAALPPPDLEAHAAAMQQAMQMKGGAGPSAGGPPPAGPEGMPPPGPSASPSAPPGAPPMGKQEVATHDPNIGLKPGGGTPGKVATENPNIGPTKKSETEVGEKLAKAEEAVGLLTGIVEKLVAPSRKAVTGLTVIPYQGSLAKKEQTGVPLKKSISDMTKAEVHEALKRVTATPKLTKAERAVVDEFYLNPGSVKLADLESIINKA